MSSGFSFPFLALVPIKKEIDTQYRPPVIER
jgi:hypothetical protein